MPKFKVNIDWFLLVLLIALIATGLTALLSASNESVFDVQLKRAVAGVILMLLISQLPLSVIKHGGFLSFVVVLIMLLLVLWIGVKVNNAQRWLNLGFYLQPSELMKIVLPLGLMYLYTNTKITRLRWWHHLLAMVIVAIPTFLVFKQPDFGTSVSVAISGLICIFFAGISIWWIITLLLLAIPLLPVLWNVVLKEYQRERVLTLLDPYKDPLGAGYHTIQSQIAVGSGGTWGKGFQEGTQAQLGFLPERHTDFIFAVYAEEFGFVGAAFLLALIILICYRCFIIAARAPDFFASCVTASLTVVFFTTAAINLAMVSGLLPVVGMPLPLVSYGGTALFANLIGFGIILSVYNYTKKTKQVRDEY